MSDLLIISPNLLPSLTERLQIMALSKFNIAVTGDSQLAGLQKSLNQIIVGRYLLDKSINVKPFRGAGIQRTS